MSHPSHTFYGIPATEIARICRVDLSTARRWKRGATHPPEMALLLVEGDLGCLYLAWAGWCLRKGQLISPEGWAATTGDVLALPLMRLQILAYQRDQRVAKETLEALVEQPSPEEVSYQIKA